MAKQETIKRSVIFPLDEYLDVQEKFYRGQLSILFRVFLSCIHNLLYSERAEEVYLFMNKKGKITLDPTEE